ncbi:helix-turn-helix domain-containing protein [Streptomyces sp. NBC_01210]|uniref:helix-turn-helix domain-containing protein n=1 Tax=Streptomyces sp. NBC_01210 TaxID=2903774 RepID=UPI002E14D1C0|nr:helix-turn-helix domain-containing protein [Streptomyces sp. NBC_01210]
MRARMIELSWSGLRVPVIAVELDCSQKMVRCWLHRFNRSGLQGIEAVFSRPWILLGRRYRRTRRAAASRGGCPSAAVEQK